MIDPWCRRMSLGMIKDFDAPEAPDSPTASTTSGSLMAARVSQSATKRRRVGRNSVETLGRKSVGSFIFLSFDVLLFHDFCWFLWRTFLPWHSSPCSGDFICVVDYFWTFVIWLLLKYSTVQHLLCCLVKFHEYMTQLELSPFPEITFVVGNPNQNLYLPLLGRGTTQ